MIYVDIPQLYPEAPFGHKWWSHLWDSEMNVDRLDAFARSIGLNRNWRQDHKFLMHYDLVPSKRELAIKKGAVKIELLDWLRTTEGKRYLAAVRGEPMPTEADPEIQLCLDLWGAEGVAHQETGVLSGHS